MKKKYITNNTVQTKKLGRNLAERILKDKIREKALVIALEGDLGGGKTTFIQGFARGLRIKEKILSPTFVLMKRFRIPQRRPNSQQKSYDLKFADFYHIDCYRIEKTKEILNLGFKKIISNPQNIVSIEWADRIKKIIPKESIWIKFEFVDKGKRKITFNTCSQISNA